MTVADQKCLCLQFVCVCFRIHHVELMDTFHCQMKCKSVYCMGAPIFPQHLKYPILNCKIFSVAAFTHMISFFIQHTQYPLSTCTIIFSFLQNSCTSVAVLCRSCTSVAVLCRSFSGILYNI